MSFFYFYSKVKNLNMAEKCTKYGMHLKRAYNHDCKNITTNNRQVCEITEDQIIHECSENRTKEEVVATNINLLANTLQILGYVGAFATLVWNGIGRFITRRRNIPVHQPDHPGHPPGPQPEPSGSAEPTKPKPSKLKPPSKPKSPKSFHKLLPNTTTSSDNDEDIIEEDNKENENKEENFNEKSK